MACGVFSVESSFYFKWAYAHDVTAAILVFQNNKMAAMLVYQDNRVGIELFSYVNTFFCSYKLAYMHATWVHTLYSAPVLPN